MSFQCQIVQKNGLIIDMLNFLRLNNIYRYNYKIMNIKITYQPHGLSLEQKERILLVLVNDSAADYHLKK